MFVREKALEGLSAKAIHRDLVADFYLFGKLKNCAKGLIFEDEDDVVEWVRETFQSISNEELQSVFTEWIKRLRKCIEVGGDYIE